ncbi:unnamed protein product [Vitrella brassicaformis CCMP3155]|uniref:Uncharacterized protein n=1 Tax=Vitrella brassicaformis (strain CCMP3155) TaxID=1169540 RepID=A0A0G4FV14_VITBC|nr:unnamed protein product [Vitrella brassicaformis CCMP3155]|eukprot:CEM18803.1 unnamed protein product [Vitrella brassicaformis CCMP3155]
MAPLPLWLPSYPPVGEISGTFSGVQQQSDSQRQPSSQLRCADVTMSAAASEGAGDSIADEPSSSAAPAAVNAVKGGGQRESVPFSAVAATVTPAIAQCLSGSEYAGMIALSRIDKTLRNSLAPILLPLLMRLLVVLLPTIGLDSLVVWVIPQLPLPEALSHGCCVAYLIEQLSRRLWMMERGGKWARWKPVLEMLYLLRGKRPLVLGDDNFGVFGSRAAFMSEREAVRQWKILSWGVTVNQGGQQRLLMDGDNILLHWYGHHWYTYQPPTLLASASPLFRRAAFDAFDPTDPPTQLASYLYSNYTSMVAFELFRWLTNSGHIRRIKSCSSFRRAYAEYRRVGELQAASPSDAAQWGAGAAVFNEMMEGWRGWHCRLVVLGSEAMGEGHMAVIRLVRDSGRTSDRSVEIFTTESAPHDHTRTVVMRVLGDHLGGNVWDEQHETDREIIFVVE